MLHCGLDALLEVLEFTLGPLDLIELVYHKDEGLHPKQNGFLDESKLLMPVLSHENVGDLITWCCTQNYNAILGKAYCSVPLLLTVGSVACWCINKLQDHIPSLNDCEGWYLSACAFLLLELIHGPSIIAGWLLRNLDDK